MSILRLLLIHMLGTSLALAMDLSDIDKEGEIDRSDGSDLGVMIMGTIANKKQPEKNVALLKENGKIRAVKQDMVILENYRVTHVQEKFIVIASKEKKHIIYQDKFANEFKLKKSNSRSNNDLLFSEDGFERTKDSIKMTATYRDNLVKKDLSKILMQATAIPHYIGDEIVGFKLLQIDAGSIYEKSGFLDHDVITSINGIKLNSASGAIKLLNGLKGMNQINVEFLRFGEAQKMNISIN